MELKTEQIGDVTIVTPSSNALDASNAKNFKSNMASVIQNCHNIVLDLKQIEFIDSYGCETLIFCHRRLSDTGRHFKLCNVQKDPLDLFKLVRLHQIVDICRTQSEAVGACHSF
jgi:anti-sigma B factor antagonist